MMETKQQWPAASAGWLLGADRWSCRRLPSHPGRTAPAGSSPATQPSPPGDTSPVRTPPAVAPAPVAAPAPAPAPAAQAGEPSARGRKEKEGKKQRKADPRTQLLSGAGAPTVDAAARSSLSARVPIRPLTRGDGRPAMPACTVPLTACCWCCWCWRCWYRRGKVSRTGRYPDFGIFIAGPRCCTRAPARCVSVLRRSPPAGQPGPGMRPEDPK
jgi:hypothetical protein